MFCTSFVELFLGDMTDTELLTHQIVGTTKVQLGELISFIGVTYRNMDGGLLIETEITQRTAESPKPILAWVTAPGSWKPAVKSRFCRQLNRLESALCR